eukprot:scaffold55069_cov69-Phaeocystis_antarctica.AAC.5
MKEEEEVGGRDGAELGRSAAQCTELNSASPASRGVPGSSGEDAARGSSRAAEADASLERPAGDDDTGLTGAARFAAGAPCSRALDGAVLTRRAPCSRALAGRATGSTGASASVAHGSPKAFTEVGSLEATPGRSADASIGLDPDCGKGVCEQEEDPCWGLGRAHRRGWPRCRIPGRPAAGGPAARKARPPAPSQRPFGWHERLMAAGGVWRQGAKGAPGEQAPGTARRPSLAEWCPLIT